MNATLRHELFDSGAAALARVLNDEFWRDNPEARGTYLCPLCCLRFWSRESLGLPQPGGTLSIDDVPPLSMRNAEARAKVLVCRECNNRAGSILEKDLARYWRQLNFMAMRPGDPLPAALHFGEESVNVLAHYRPTGGEADDSFTLVAIGSPPGEHDHPDDHRRMWAGVDRVHEDGAWDGAEFSIVPRESFNRDRVALGILKSAYLLVFARYGYRWVLSAPMRDLQRVVMDAVVDGRVTNPGVAILIDPEDPGTTVRIGLAQGPVPVLLAQLGHNIVVFPRWDSHPDDYGSLVEVGGPTLELSGINWAPVDVHPGYLLDQ